MQKLLRAIQDTKKFFNLVKWADAPGEPVWGHIRDYEPGDVLNLNGARTIEEERFYFDPNGELEDQIPSGVLVLPEGLTEIKRDGFKCCSQMDAIVCPKTLKSIGESAFENCHRLQIVEFQEGLETIASCAFSGHNLLTDVFLPNSLKTLWMNSFEACIDSEGKHITIHMSGTLATNLRYGSQYGTAKRYAEALAGRTESEISSFEEQKDLEAYDTIVYIGALYAGGVLGLKKTLSGIHDLQNKRIIIATVGLADPNDRDNIETIQNGLKKQLPENIWNHARIFHLRGGIDYARLNLKHRTMMALLYGKAKGLPEEKKTAEVRAMIDTYGKRVDFVDLNSLDPIIREIGCETP